MNLLSRVEYEFKGFIVWIQKKNASQELFENDILHYLDILKCELKTFKLLITVF